MITIRTVSGSEWQYLVELFRDATYESGFTYGKAAAVRIGGKAKFLACERDGVVIGVASVRIKDVPILGRGVAWIPSGPLIQRKDSECPDQETVHEILKALRQHVLEEDGHILRLRFSTICGYDNVDLTRIATEMGFHPTDRVQGYHTIVLDLERGPDALFKALDSNWRRNLRFALNADLGLDLEIGDGSNIDFQQRFLALFEEIEQSKKFQPGISPQFYFQNVGSDLPLEILIVSKDGQDVAGSITTHKSASAVMLYSATTLAGRDLRAGYFINWSCVLRSCDRGLSYLDLGGIDPLGNPSVVRFKSGMKGRTVDADGPFESVPRGILGKIVLQIEGVHKKIRGK